MGNERTKRGKMQEVAIRKKRSSFPAFRIYVHVESVANEYVQYAGTEY